MGELTIITETGMFHSAARVTVEGRTTWYGFKPIAHSHPFGAGFVDTSDRSKDVKHWATWEIDDKVLKAAVDKTTKAYASAYYVVGGQDCVSFTADLCRACNMRVPLLNFSPYGFVKVLQFWNPPKNSGQAPASKGRF